MGNGVLAHFDADIATTHLVGNRGSSAGAEKRVKDEVTGVGGDVENALDQAFGLGGQEDIVFEESEYFLF